MKDGNKKERLLKAKIAVALQDEYGRVPTEEKIDTIFHLTRVMYKAVLGLHYKRQEQKKSAQSWLSSKSLFGKVHPSFASRLSIKRIIATSMKLSLVCTSRS